MLLVNTAEQREASVVYFAARKDKAVAHFERLLRSVLRSVSIRQGLLGVCCILCAALEQMRHLTLYTRDRVGQFLLFRAALMPPSS